MIVWGRVNLHMTDRKEEMDGFFALLVLLLVLLGGDDDEDMDSESRKISFLWALLKFCVDDNGFERDIDRAVRAGWGTKAKANDAFDQDPHCKETRKKPTADSSFRHQRNADDPANIV